MSKVVTNLIETAMETLVVLHKEVVKLAKPVSNEESYISLKNNTSTLGQFLSWKCASDILPFFQLNRRNIRKRIHEAVYTWNGIRKHVDIHPKENATIIIFGEVSSVGLAALLAHMSEWTVYNVLSDDNAFKVSNSVNSKVERLHYVYLSDIQRHTPYVVNTPVIVIFDNTSIDVQDVYQNIQTSETMYFVATPSAHFTDIESSYHKQALHKYDYEVMSPNNSMSIYTMRHK